MKRRAKSRARSERVKSEGVGLAAGREDEEGVDALTLPDGVVWSYEGDAEQTRRTSLPPPRSLPLSKLTKGRYRVHGQNGSTPINLQ